MAIKKIHFGLMCFVLVFNSLYSQSSSMSCYSNMTPIKKSDSVGKYDINCIVLGIVELDSLVGVTYWYRAPFQGKNMRFKLWSKNVQYSTGMFYTIRRNIPLSPSTKSNNVKSLILNKDYFLMENRCGVIMEYIYPKCNDEEKDRLENTLLNCTTVYSYAYMPLVDSTWKETIKVKKIKGKECLEECFFYDTFGGKNEYLLVIMNKRWHDLLVFSETNPPQMSDDLDLYVKYLVPLKPAEKTSSISR